VSDVERIAKLEEQHNQMMTLLKETRDDVKVLRDTLTKYHGVMAGVVLTVSAIWAGVLGVWTFVKHKVG
jgi:low affinity Fe/Cu permease